MIDLQTECGGKPPPLDIMKTSSTSSITPNGSSQNHNPRYGSARERTLQAVEYYNSNVLRARVGAGLAARSSVNERHLLNGRSQNGNNQQPQQRNSSIQQPPPESLYRSNSSLELLHDYNGIHHESLNHLQPNLRREYGSHGSIDVISSTNHHQTNAERTPTTSESFFAMLQDYRPAVLGVIGTDQRSPGPAEYLKGKINIENHQINVQYNNNNNINSNNNSNNNINNNNSNMNHQSYSGDISEDSVDRGSPKLRTKLRLWGPNKPTTARISNHVSSVGDECSFITTLSADIEERQRRRAFAHFDCQSLTANLGYAAKLRGLLLARRRNTATGASAASMVNARSSTPDGTDNAEELGDGQTNELLESCPYFRNEIGGEDEREVSLTRFHSNLNQKRAIHRPPLAYGVSILECPPGENLWREITCPFQRGQRPIESVDNGAKYYRDYFLDQEHQNWFGMDEQLGPIAISIKKERILLPIQQQQQLQQQQAAQQQLQISDLPGKDKEPLYQFRMIVRTSELLTLRGSVTEESVPNPKGQGKSITTKEVIEYVAPEIQISSLRLGINTAQCEQQLLKLDEQGLTNKYKVGILYCRKGQGTEEDMYNNEDAGPAFIEFLDVIGKRIRLKGFEQYKAGLDNKTDSTGTHSLYANYQDCEIMFHVSTMLPFTANNRQQLLRKRHIGNDIVTIVFQEPGSLPFTPKNIRSQFQHVFIIVRAVNPCTENTQYKISVSRSKEVPVFGPPIKHGGTYPKGKSFSEFLLAKVINAENAAHRSEKFVTMATRTRQEYLKDLATNYCTTTLIDTGPKFSIFPSKKKERTKPRFNGDVTQRGAFCWQVVLHDTGQVTSVDCFLGISTETFVLIEECSRQIVFVTPCKSILGWSTSGYCIRIYHHQSECITLSMRESTERDEQLEVIERLRATTNGCGAIELQLRRNPMGQLGFHVQPDGVVTQVEMSGQAWTAGLRQGCRLVEICKIAVATLSHDEMVDLLKTSSQVTVTVIESFSDCTPRRGCFLQNCKFNIINYEADYENLDDKPNKSTKNTASAQLKQPAGVNHRRRYERNFSPPRSSNSSGYGTGSSSRSFSIPNEQHMRLVTDMGTLTSSSSGHSSNEDRWYDILEVTDAQENGQYSKQQQQQQQQLPFNSQQYQQQQHHQHHQNHHQQSPRQQHQQQNEHQHSNQPPTTHSSQQIHHHQKISHTSSLPLSNTTRPLSIHEPIDVKHHQQQHPQHASLNKVTAINEQRPMPRTANIEYLMTKIPKIPEMVNEVRQIHLNADGNQTDPNTMGNEQIYNAESIKSVSTTDDETASLNEVGQLRRSSTTTNVHKNKSANAALSSSSASSNSRNNSPRPLTADAKLRSSVTNRNIQQIQQRNSVNYTSSTLQEDLMKLINPDYMSSDDNFHSGNLTQQKPQKNTVNSHSLGNISNLGGGLKQPSTTNTTTATHHMLTDDLLLIRKKSRSREGINLGSHGLPISSSIDNNNKKLIKNCEPSTNSTSSKKPPITDNDIIFTTARPATIITPSDKLDQCLTNVLHIKEENLLRSSTRSVKSTSGSVPVASSTGYHQSQSIKPIINNSNKSSPHLNDNLMQQPLPLIANTKEVDWTSLVDRAIMQVNEGLKNSSTSQQQSSSSSSGKHDFFDNSLNYNPRSAITSQSSISSKNTMSTSTSTSSGFSVPPPTENGLSSTSTSNEHQISSSTSCASSSSSAGSSSTASPSTSNNSLTQVSSSTSLPELQSQVSQLEDRVSRETRRRKSLEVAVRRLTEENRRLQDESQAAVQQLRRFTEWFFQTIDRQT